MIVYHATKRQESLTNILATKVLLPGHDTGESSTEHVHVSKTPFVQGGYALDVIGPDTNEAWILTCIIPDDTVLIPDPTDEGETYEGEWVVHEGPLRVHIKKVQHISNVLHWEDKKVPLSLQ